MNRFKRFATEHPVTFGFVVTVMYIFMLVVSTVLGAVWPGSGEAYGQPGGVLGRLLSITILLVVLVRLGWFRLSGFAHLGRWQTWLIMLLPLAYTIVGTAYAMTGSFNFSLSDMRLTSLVVLFIVTAAFLEEVAFRGLILYGFVRVWSSTKRGLITSVLVSSLFFAGMHLVDFLGGRPLPNVFLQSVEAFFLGIVLGSLVLIANSIYPAVFSHAILNLAGYMIFGSQGPEPTLASWLVLSVLMLPLALYSIYLIRLPERSTVSIAV